MDEPTGGIETSAQEERAQRMHALRTPLTVAVGRVQLLRRRLGRGEDPARVAAELEALEAALVRLAAAVERVDNAAPE